ncbi:MAG: diguanylate cyclase, partial [Rhizobiaceae bacterium]|nr:diguanylate cyclase [Rhizobiaceae bacterium]
MKIRHSLILLSAALVLMPALFISAWTYNQTVRAQFDEVSERHLLLAKNLRGTLERYYLDTKLIFDSVSQNMAQDIINPTAKKLIANMNFMDISLVDEASAKIHYRMSIDNTDAPEFMKLRIMNTARKIARQDTTTFSSVISTPDGINIILLVRQIGEKIAIGKLKTDYFVKLGKSISFGKKGYAAIVDAKGNVLAHPLESWTAERKNIANIAPVKLMMEKQTGIRKFYLPAQKSELIAGFTSVKGPGWGVMIPQPVSELYEKSAGYWKSSLSILVVSFAFAILFAAWISIRSTQPLLKLIAANQNLDNPDQQKILTPPDFWAVPTEIRQLYVTHNEMINRLHTKHADILRMAYSDLVTGLPTREAFNQLVQEEISGLKSTEKNYLLVFLDLDDFKAINDTMGHEVGDTVLVIVAKQVADAISNYTDLEII